MDFTISCPIKDCKWLCKGSNKTNFDVFLAGNDLEIHLSRDHDWRMTEIKELFHDHKRMNIIVKEGS